MTTRIAVNDNSHGSGSAGNSTGDGTVVGAAGSLADSSGIDSIARSYRDHGTSV